MGEIWEAPAKVNFNLMVGRRGSDGFHPIHSLVQSIEWVDLIDMDESDEDHLVVRGADLPDDRSNLIWKALDAVDLARPQLVFDLDKRIPAAAGLGGGSSDAAAALMAVAEVTGWPASVVRSAAARSGADVPYFLSGGSATIEGRGERVTPLETPFGGFAVAVAVPPFELATPDVYQRWDDLNGPVGVEYPSKALPPSLRRSEFRNDLTPAALSLKPELGDWMRDLSERWEIPVAMSGSGPALFAWFPSLDEAGSAASSAPSDARAAVGADLRPNGVARPPI